MPTCWIIAGPNGSGKTTFALQYLPQIAQCNRFINADLIAAGLSPLAPDRQLLAASRLFLKEIETSIQQQENFAFETTLSGRSYLKLIRRLRTQGWRTELIYLALPSPEISLSASPSASATAATTSRSPTSNAAFPAASPISSTSSAPKSISANAS
jgi:predicted ABC-type ATPase